MTRAHHKSEGLKSDKILVLTAAAQMPLINAHSDVSKEAIQAPRLFFILNSAEHEIYPAHKF